MRCVNLGFCVILALQRHLRALTKFAHGESRVCGRKQQGKAVFYPSVNPCVRKHVHISVAVGLLCVILGVVETSGGSVEDVNTLIDRIQANYDRTPALTAEFIQVATLTSIDRQQTSAGRLYIEKPHHIRWEYTQPDSQTILYDGNILRIYTPRRRQVLQSKIDEDNRRNVALLFLAGVGKLREAFTISLLPNTQQAAGVSACSPILLRRALPNCKL